MATPDKPSQSSSNGSKNGSGDNTVAFIVIAAIVVLAVQYVLTGTNFAVEIWEEFTAPELSKTEIAEVLTHAAFYAGWPKGGRGHVVPGPTSGRLEAAGPGPQASGRVSSRRRERERKRRRDGERTQVRRRD